MVDFCPITDPVILEEILKKVHDLDFEFDEIEGDDYECSTHPDCLEIFLLSDGRIVLTCPRIERNEEILKEFDAKFVTDWSGFIRLGIITPKTVEFT